MKMAGLYIHNLPVALLRKSGAEESEALFRK